MAPALSISVVVPAHQAASLLLTTLPAILEGLAEGVQRELIVVDDASTDATAEVAARYADRVVRLGPPPAGPAAARNAGAAAARGEWLLFVDADVRLHPDTLGQLVRSIAAHPEAVAIFGSYDAEPEGPGLVSRFRNLLHHYVHSRSAGPAETFWAGLGAVRRDAFRTAGGFDAIRYPRPQIEDIELGYRLRSHGGDILLDPLMQGAHLKSWSLLSMIRTDFRDRGIPWTRLLLERRGAFRGTLAADHREGIRIVLVVLAVSALFVWLLSGYPWARVTFFAAAAGHLAACSPVYLWFFRRKGFLSGLVSIPLLGVYYLVAFAAGVAGLLLHLGHRPRAA